MEGMFRQIGIYSPKGQLYTPQDADQIMPYREDIKGQLLQEGINEAGAMSSWIAASTAYSNHGISMIPVYIFYSMFGFQRIGDFAWAAGDSRARGFLVGGTAGRTTLNGEGLQHQDGHSQLFAHFIPNCRSYDPTFHYELATIFHHGLKRMYEEQNDEYFYITTMNENYTHPAMPEGSEEGIIRGMYLFRPGQGEGYTVNLIGSGTILRESLAAAEILESEHGCNVNVWSATSLNELARDGQACERHNRLHPDGETQQSWVERCLAEHAGVTVASTDYIKLYAEQIRPFVPGPYATLGTDGFGRSGGREELRRHFEVDRGHIVVTALKSLADKGDIAASEVADVIRNLGIDTDRPHPLTL
jgi:pyruvate dehydrogenase E1 component